jgi:hypothetical protein
MQVQIFPSEFVQVQQQVTTGWKSEKLPAADHVAGVPRKNCFTHG